MGRTYLADKETLDNVNTNIGNTGDTNGTTVTGSIFGKLNVLLSLWTSARAAKVDSTSADASSAKTSASQAASNTATSNTANANGTLSQKLTYIINEAAKILSRVDGIAANTGGEQKVPTLGDCRNPIPVNYNNGTWCVGAVTINEAGVLHSVSDVSLTFGLLKGAIVTVDGRAYPELGQPPSSTHKYLAQTKDGEIKWMTGTDVAVSVPIRFSTGCRVDINTNGAGNTMPSIRVCYETYKDIGG